MSETAIRLIQHEHDNISHTSKQNMNNRVQKLLRDELIPQATIDKISAEMSRDIYHEIAEELNTKYKVEQYVMENFKFVMPESIKIGQESIGYYIPIESTLQNILSDPTFIITRHGSI